MSEQGATMKQGAAHGPWGLIVDELTELGARLSRIERMLREERREQVPTAPQRTFTAKEFAERIGVSRDTVRLWVLKGKVKKRNGRIPPSELRRFGL